MPASTTHRGGIPCECVSVVVIIKTDPLPDLEQAMEAVKQSLTESNTTIMELTQQSSEYKTQLGNTTLELNTATKKVCAKFLLLYCC